MAKGAADRALNGMCSIIYLMLQWVERANIPCDDERDAFQASRVLILRRDVSMIERQKAACTRIYPAHDAERAEVRELRSAVLTLVPGIYALDSKAPAKDIRRDHAERERLILTYACNLGALLKIQDAARQARMAATEGKPWSEGESKPGKFPDATFARQLVLGQVFARYREMSKLSQQDLCLRVNAQSEGRIKVTPGQLAKLEAGIAWRDAPLDAIAEALGQTREAIEARAVAAHTFAVNLAAFMGIESRDDWFREMVSIDGENVARAVVMSAASVALRRNVGGS